MTQNQPHALYRFFDASDDLLYVGVTANPGARWPKHASGKPWWTEVSRVQVENYTDRPSVLAAEKAAIQTEAPRYNVMHKSRSGVPTASSERAPDSVVALGLRDGQCPVGFVESWGDDWIRLDLFSFWSGYFSGPTASYRMSDVVEVRHARLMTIDEKRQCCLPTAEPIWHTAELGVWQSEWKHQHGLVSEEDLVNVREGYQTLMFGRV